MKFISTFYILKRLLLAYSGIRKCGLSLQSVLLGKVQEAFSSLSVDHDSDYDVKSAILKAYELVPDTYC